MGWECEQGLVGGGWWLASDEGWRDAESDIRSVWSIRAGVRGVAWCVECCKVLLRVEVGGWVVVWVGGG